MLVLALPALSTCYAASVLRGNIYIESERQLAQEAPAAWAQARPRASGSRLALYHVHVNTAGLRPPSRFFQHFRTHSVRLAGEVLGARRATSSPPVPGSRTGQIGSWRRKRVRLGRLSQRQHGPAPPGPACTAALQHVCAGTAGLRASSAAQGLMAPWSSRAARVFFLRTPGSSGGQQPTGPLRPPPEMHTYVQTTQSPTCLQVQSSPLKPPITDLTGPVATPTTCGVICHMQPAWIKSCHKSS
jgi:hypothetical protein